MRGWFGKRNAPSQSTPSGYPEGLWRCTHAAKWAQENGFQVGRVYLAHQVRCGSSVRIYPKAKSLWAPYWEKQNNSFCYPPKDLDFEWIGPVKCRTPTTDEGRGT